MGEDEVFKAMLDTCWKCVLSFPRIELVIPQIGAKFKKDVHEKADQWGKGRDICAVYWPGMKTQKSIIMTPRVARGRNFDNPALQYDEEKDGELVGTSTEAGYAGSPESDEEKAPGSNQTNAHQP